MKENPVDLPLGDDEREVLQTSRHTGLKLMNKKENPNLIEKKEKVPSIMQKIE